MFQTAEDGVRRRKSERILADVEDGPGPVLAAADVVCHQRKRLSAQCPTERGDEYERESEGGGDRHLVTATPVAHDFDREQFTEQDADDEGDDKGQTGASRNRRHGGHGVDEYGS